MDNLYFDIGNSTIKISYRSEGEWVEPAVFEHDSMLTVLEWLADLRQEFDRYIIASVVDRAAKALSEGLGQEINFRIRTHDIPEKFVNYKSVDTLGIDRLLAGIGAWHVHQNACVIIDGGTACTVDYIDREGVFQGGVIMPGLSMLEKSLQQFTPELPSVRRELPDDWPGKSTRECLQWGITGSFVDGIESALDRYDKMGDYDILLTGGDIDVLRKYVDRPMTSDRLLVFRGMDFIFGELSKEGETDG